MSGVQPMWYFATSALCLTFLYASGLVGSTIVRAQTQLQMSRDACQELEQLQSAVEAAYRQILDEYGETTPFARKLGDSQRAWVAFRDAQLEAMYPAEDKQTVYGSTYPLCRCVALMELAKYRLEELQRWVKGVKEGDVCRGSARPSDANATY